MLTLYKNIDQSIDVNRSDFPADIPDDVLWWFVHNFNHWFDVYSFNELLIEFYPNHDNDTSQKKSNNWQNLTTSIKWMINDLTKMNKNM